jgi:hypothetical protein
MEPAQTPASPAPTAGRQPPLFLLGAATFGLGLAIYIVQIRMGQLIVPWYLPILATIGVALMAVSVARRRGIARIVGLALFVLVCGFEWFFLLVVAKSPGYRGPATPGQSVPSFAATLADGQPFTSEDLRGGESTVLTFFRGRW